jgi:hypothetical protein
VRPTLPLAVLYGVGHDGAVDWYRRRESVLTVWAARLPLRRRTRPTLRRGPTPHEHVAAVAGTAQRLGVPELIDPAPSRQRDLVLAMLIGQVIAPGSKLALTRGLRSETASSSLGVHPRAPRRICHRGRGPIPDQGGQLARARCRRLIGSSRRATLAEPSVTQRKPPQTRHTDAASAEPAGMLHAPWLASCERRSPRRGPPFKVFGAVPRMATLPRSKTPQL